MRDESLLRDLLNAEDEVAVVAALTSRGLLQTSNRWRYLGNMPNNQSVVHNQQSTPAAALVEKFTNGLDAILLRRCKAQGIDPRGAAAPATMAKAAELFFGDMADRSAAQIRSFAEVSMVLYATGSKASPSLSTHRNCPESRAGRGVPFSILPN